MQPDQFFLGSQHARVGVEVVTFGIGDDDAVRCFEESAVAPVAAPSSCFRSVTSCHFRHAGDLAGGIFEVERP